MVKLTFKEGKNFIPIAKIESKDKLNNEILFINPNADDDGVEDDRDMQLYDIDYNKYLPKMKPREAVMTQNLLSKHLLKHNLPLEDNMQMIYKNIIEDTNKEMRLKPGQKFIPIPNPNLERTITYIFGPSGSGKSYMTAMLVKQFRKLNPNSEVYLFSKLTDDKVLDEQQVKRIDINTLKDEPIDVAEIPEGSLCIMDDCDCIEDKKVNEEIQKLQNSILQVGRHHKISLIITSHLGSDYKRSRVVLSEMHSCVVYPSSGSFQQIKYILQHYMGMDNKQIQRIKGLKSRWALISRNYPIYVLSENEVFLV